ncbi:hypothetical protein COY27_04535 [Candidatus Woesearchaeota archaeon CG_4_10_14_0_2_um_filter_33_13]|nr:MAG: hypothetical protein COY27_04535 [Candidatus Woesearchaeota archaeon CG_4_10_14_0_2_um_filter_33_13]
MSVLNAKEPHHILKFKCKQCGHCCDSTYIQLAPFDIKNICDTLDISTQKFHEKYSMFNSSDNIPRCYLRNRPRCPFKENKLCTIYNNRPLRCRLFPLGRVYPEDLNESSFLILPEEKCIGFDTGKKIKISEFLEQQNVNSLDKLSEEWNHFLITLKDNPTIEKQEFKQSFKETFYGFENKDASLKEFMEELYQKWNIINQIYQIRV